MKTSRFSAALFVASLLCASGAFASDTNTNKKSLHLDQDVTVEGTRVPAGDYKVEWNGPGPSVQVSILKGKDTIATVPAQVVNETTPNTQDGYGVEPAQDGGQQLTQIFFSGKNYTLEFQPGASQTSNPSGNR
jgi:hypothetical protein